MSYLARNFICSSFIILSDLISIFVSMYLALWLFFININDSSTYIQDNHVERWILLHWLLAVCCVAWYGMRLRHYFYRKTFWYELKEILRTLIIFSIIELAVIAFSKWYFSRYLWLMTWLLAICLVPLSRMAVKWILAKFGLWSRETWIIGNGVNAKEALMAINSEKNLGFKIVGFISGDGKASANATINGIKVINVDCGWLVNINPKTQFIVAVETEQSEVRNYWLRNLMTKGFRYVSVIPTLRGMPLDSIDMSFIFGHEVMIFRMQHNLAKLSSRFLKRSFDIFVSIGIIIALSPLFIFIMKKIKDGGGPTIYGHERVGKNGKTFKCLKFRTMVVNSSEVLNELLKTDPIAKEEWETSFKLKNDPRITKIGAFLRKTSLDELPQLFNVLKGEMSLVGPRPVIAEELERYNDKVDYYLLSKPGITGLWQVSGRSDVDYDTRVYLDTWYVKNWSMWNDIAILFKTVSVVLKKDGAY